MGDSRLAYEVGTFSSRVDDIHIGGVLAVVYPRGHPITWSTSIYNVEQRPEIYDTLLEEFPKDYGDVADDEYHFPPSDRWSVGEDHTDFRGHVASIRPRS